jgi:hypothetical protein
MQNFHKIKISTEGLLVFASAQGLLKTYQHTKFDYDFPDGISGLLNEQIAIALLTSSGNNIIIEFAHESLTPSSNIQKEINQYLRLDPNDELLILTHAEFTQICSGGGDYNNHGYPIQKIKDLEAGTYQLNIKVENVEAQFETLQAYFRLWVTLKKTSHGQDFKNTVIEIADE